MIEDKTLELQMIAAINTTRYCEDEGIIEWQYDNKSNMEVYTEIAQLYFATQIINLTKIQA